MDGEEMTPLHYACVCQATTVMTIKVSWRPRRGERSVVRGGERGSTEPARLHFPCRRSAAATAAASSSPLRSCTPSSHLACPLLPQTAGPLHCCFRPQTIVDADPEVLDFKDDSGDSPLDWAQSEKLPSTVCDMLEFMDAASIAACDMDEEALIAAIASAKEKVSVGGGGGGDDSATHTRADSFWLVFRGRARVRPSACTSERVRG